MDKKTLGLAVSITVAICLGLFLLKVPAVVTVTDTIREQFGAQSGPTFICNTKAFDPAAVDVDSNSTTSVTIIGAIRGDIVTASFNASTSLESFFVTANVSSTNEVIVGINSAASTSLNLPGGTVRACVSKSYL